MNKPILNIVVALHCEAKPLIAHFKLKKILNSPFSIFANNENTIFLIISGVGKVRIASAVTYLAIKNATSVNTFLNVGIAGSIQYSRGQAILANKITENSTKRNWYPFVTAFKNFAQSWLVTYDSPQYEYHANNMMDMEGSAFFQIASLFATQEHIQILKIISDTQKDEQNEINDGVVQALIADNLGSVEILASYLFKLATLESNLSFHYKNIEDFLKTWHFSCSQTLQLQECLRKWQVKLQTIDPFIFCKNEKTSKQVINKIITKLEENANCIH